MHKELADSTVSELVNARPDRSRVFEALGIDYCCGGRIPLSEACERHGLDTAGVVRRIEAHDASGGHAVTTDYTALGLAELADHIVATHHAYLREELPRLAAMLSKIAHKRGDRNPRLPEAWGVFQALREELESHLLKEERVLFPALRAMEARETTPKFTCGSVATPIAVMEHEHDSAGAALRRLRTLTDGYSTPEWGCPTYRALMDGLRRLEEDTHLHIHKENNILFPAAMGVEEARRGAA